MLTIKLQYGEDIRRISLHEDSNLTVSDLYKRIHHMFPALADVPYERLFISYKDAEGDAVRITNDLEYSEAVHTLQEAGGVRLLRLNIQNKFAPFQPTQTTPIQTIPTQTQAHSQTQTPPQPTTTSPINVAAMAAIIPSMMSQLTNNITTTTSTTHPQTVDPIARLVGSILTSQPGGASFTPLAVPPEVVSGLMQNIGQLIPPEQLMPAVTSMMQSPAIQQMIPQILSSIFGTQASQNTPQQQAPTNTHPSSAPHEPSVAPTTTTSTTTSFPHSPPRSQSPTFSQSPAVSEIQRPSSAGSDTTATTTHTYNHNNNHNNNELKQTSSSTSSPVVVSPVGVSRESHNNNNNSGAQQSDQFSGSRFGDLLQQLNEIGFTDKEKNIMMLAKHSGDMNRVVDDLVSDQQE